MTALSADPLEDAMTANQRVRPLRDSTGSDEHAHARTLCQRIRKVRIVEAQYQLEHVTPSAEVGVDASPHPLPQKR
eukprot:scaffold23434_cov135-Isochrysis_galbana.AAC.12